METIACVACHGTRQALVAASGDAAKIGASYPADYGPHEPPVAVDRASGGRRGIASGPRQRLKELDGGVTIPDLPPGARVLGVGCATGRLSRRCVSGDGRVSVSRGEQAEADPVARRALPQCGAWRY